mmetsp:Transcript_25255/g.29236  ORF Transcript_25255/g.29236 Transcript_25255/m.29236 type:complete len:94 (+) Transcript_25255:2-283(+)
MKISLLSIFLIASYTSTNHAFSPIQNHNNNPPINTKTSNVTSSSKLMAFPNPFNEMKKKLVQSLAGPYDEEAIRTKITSYIENEPVLMLSFVK